MQCSHGMDLFGEMEVTCLFRMVFLDRLALV